VRDYAPASSGPPVDYAFGILASVSSTGFTRWSILYDTTTLTLFFRTEGSPHTRRVSLEAFDFGCGAPVKIYDFASAGAGDVSGSFVRYTLAANRKLIGLTYSSVDFLKRTPARVLDENAAYPDSLACARDR
jgi:hypothetical protein